MRRLVPSGFSGGAARHLPGASAFLISRALNAALILAQLTLVARGYAAAEAARFFVYWTLVWAGSVWLRFGFDQLIPKHAALAQLSGEPQRLGGFRQIVRWTFPALAILAPWLLLALVPHITLGTALLAWPAFLLGAAAWMAAYLLGALAKGYGRVGLSGFSVGVIPAAGVVIAVPVAQAVSGSWLTLAWVSGATLFLAAVVCGLLVDRWVGRAELRTLLTASWADRRDPQVVPAGILLGISEASMWVPLWLGSALSLSSTALAGLYGAIRLSAVFSWLFTSVVQAVTPILAAAFARRDYARVKRLVLGAGGWGALSTIPVAILGMLLAGTLLDLIHGGYGKYADVLVVLIAARLIDAVTGPVAETLILGERAQTELANQVLSAAVIVVLGLILKPPLGAFGLGIASAAAFSLVNVIRVAEVWSLMRGRWRTSEGCSGATEHAAGEPRRWRSREVLAFAVLALATAAGSLVASIAGLRQQPVVFWLMLAITGAAIAAVVAEATRRTEPPRRLVWTSPVAVAAVVWAVTFLLRPIELYATPNASIYPLFQLGFTIDDLTRAVALACAGCGAWSIGYLIFLGRARSAPEPAPGSWPLRLQPALLLLGIGSVLWLALFLRQGGVHALLHSAASLRKGQGSSFYGFVGIWIVQGVALYAWAALLNGGGQRAKWLLALSIVISLIGGVCLELRSLTVLGAFAGLVIYLRYRRPTRRMIAVAATIVVVGVPALALASTIRNYTQLFPTSRAISLAFKTPPAAFDTGDLSPFDDMLAISKLAPSSVGLLNGSTLADIPLALVPRSIWSGKPQPVDLRVTSLLYRDGTGGSPLMMQGELYWNFGVPGVLVGAAVVGALMAFAVRFAARSRSRYGLLAYAVFVPSTLSLLTRALATMTGDLVLAVLGVCISVWVLSRGERAAARKSQAVSS